MLLCLHLSRITNCSQLLFPGLGFGLMAAGCRLLGTAGWSKNEVKLVFLNRCYACYWIGVRAFLRYYCYYRKRQPTTLGYTYKTKNIYFSLAFMSNLKLCCNLKCINNITPCWLLEKKIYPSIKTIIHVLSLISNSYSISGFSIQPSPSVRVGLCWVPTVRFALAHGYSFSYLF